MSKPKARIRDRAGNRYRLRDEIPSEAMPAFRALKMAPPQAGGEAFLRRGAIRGTRCHSFLRCA